ncbi:transposase [Solemya velum gill symbiont]|uniref:Transposase n=1 Tax=Solemya velum gill symbiont TaxID=2340 RepID=A0A0B0H6E0_SOVGS|nr:IS5 family transposase [Solemya velum gill symbiont]KHF24690.1 transposase [Solemya velum gill symbiont]
MKQLSFTTAEHDLKKKQTRREKFLSEMDLVTPCQLIEPFYPKAGRPGRPPIGLEKMLRIYFLQQWYSLSDPAAEEALYDMESMRQFVWIVLHEEPIPDETTILKFRRLLEEHHLTEALFAEVRCFLDEKGLFLKQGTIVDATMIAAPPSTKNKKRKRDAEMSQTRKANQWYFGMKSHIGVDADSGLIHSIEATTAKTHDSKVIDQLLHGDEKDVHGDKAYASNERHLLNSTPGKRIWCMPFKKQRGQDLPEWQREINRGLSSLRAKVEHPFRVIKCQFGYRKVRYKGLEKNARQQQTLFALANLYLARRQLLAMAG